MRNIFILLFSIVLFFVAYQVRSGFIATKDYNDPGDSREYFMAANAAVKEIKQINSFETFKEQLPAIVNNFDTHSAPLTIAYYTFLELFFSEQQQTINSVLSSLLVVFLFMVCVRFFPVWVAVVISLAAVVYTPLFALLYSFMPERFGSFFVPIMVIVAIYCSFRANSSILFAFLTGISLGFVSLYRIELRWVGIPFTLLWVVISLCEIRSLKNTSHFAHKRNQIKTSLNNMIHKIISGRKTLFVATVIFISYFLIAGGWMVISKLVNTSPYYQTANVIGAFYNTYNYSRFGWSFDTAPIKTTQELIPHIISQGPIHLLWLEQAQVIRLWFRPATAYAPEYLMPDSVLFFIHSVLTALAILGFRKMFFHKTFLFLFVVFLWGGIFSYLPEDMRRQVPLIGILMIFSAAGLFELQKIILDKKHRILTLYLLIAFILLGISRDWLYGLLSFVYPKYITFFPLRILVWFGCFLLLVRISVLLISFDKKTKFLFQDRRLRILPALVPMLIFLSLSWYNMRSYYWHEWNTNILPEYILQQAISIRPHTLARISKSSGYLLIDIKDPQSGKTLKVSLNGEVQKDRMQVGNAFSPIDLRVIRQFQRGMPRLGYGPVEDEVASLSAFPNMHHWLITEIDGKKLKEKNIISIKNMSNSHNNTPLIFGDYYSNFDNQIYDGPTARIFQGSGSFLKYEVDSDIRLPEKKPLISIENSSVLYINNKKTDDLSGEFGVQTGRYRIFLLFPYSGGDPVNIF